MKPRTPATVPGIAQPLAAQPGPWRKPTLKPQPVLAGVDAAPKMIRRGAITLNGTAR